MVTSQVEAGPRPRVGGIGTSSALVTGLHLASEMAGPEAAWGWGLSLGTTMCCPERGAVGSHLHVFFSLPLR